MEATLTSCILFAVICCAIIAYQAYAERQQAKNAANDVSEYYKPYGQVQTETPTPSNIVSSSYNYKSLSVSNQNQVETPQLLEVA